MSRSSRTGMRGNGKLQRLGFRDAIKGGTEVLREAIFHRTRRLMVFLLVYRSKTAPLSLYSSIPVEGTKALHLGG
jgi:hypothetical protein